MPPLRPFDNGYSNPLLAFELIIYKGSDDLLVRRCQNLLAEVLIHQHDGDLRQQLNMRSTCLSRGDEQRDSDLDRLTIQRFPSHIIGEFGNDDGSFVYGIAFCMGMANPSSMPVVPSLSRSSKAFLTSCLSLTIPNSAAFDDKKSKAWPTF